MGSSSSKGSKAAHDFVDEMITKHPVVVFSKTTCGFCTMAKKVLKSIPVIYHVVELNTKRDEPTGADIQLALEEKTGQRTVPNVFVGGASIGGGTEVRNLHQTGQLIPKLKQANAL